MNRRRYLSWSLGVGISGLVGCAGSLDRAVQPTQTESPSDLMNSSDITGADGTPTGICNSKPRPGRIPAIVDPAFGPNWDDVDQSSLTDSAPVIGIKRAGEARAYPVGLLASAEIVNDNFDIPVLVTYCPLCVSGLTAERRVNGQKAVFQNTSLTWKPPDALGQRAINEGRVFGISYRDGQTHTTATNDPNLVMFDEPTGSYWSQLLAQAICGPLTGESLSLIPSEATDWETWRNEHPETSVLLPPPVSALSIK